MSDYMLHHVSLITANLPEAVAFYVEVLGFSQIPRPSFPRAGAWLNAGGVELHLTDFPQGSFRTSKTVGTDDVHFAMRVRDFGVLIDKLNRHGYRDDLDEPDAKRLIIKRQSLAGYSQLYLMDPDSHLIELNAAY